MLNKRDTWRCRPASIEEIGRFKICQTTKFTNPNKSLNESTLKSFKIMATLTSCLLLETERKLKAAAAAAGTYAFLSHTAGEDL